MKLSFQTKVALLLGIALVAGSFLLSGLDNSRHTLSLEKAKEIQTARREFHSLSHQYAQQTDGTRPAKYDEGGIVVIDKAKVLEAEERFNQLHAEVEAIRNSRPWLTHLLRFGGLTICLLAGLYQLANRPRSKPATQLDAASASSIAAYEMEVERRS